MTVLFKIHAGDFKSGQLRIPLMGKPRFLMSEGFFGKSYDYRKEDVLEIEVVGGEREKTASGTAGGAALGGVLLGGFGVIVGALAGGNKNKTIFAIKFNDGKKALVEVKAKEYVKVQAALF